MARSDTPNQEEFFEPLEHTDELDEAIEERLAVFVALGYLADAKAANDKEEEKALRGMAKSHYFDVLRTIATRRVVGLEPVSDEEARSKSSRVSHETMVLEGEFLSQFWTGNKAGARKKKMDELEAEIARLAEAKQEEATPDEELPQVPQFKRLRAISEDEVAGFMPKDTHALNRTMTWLDYREEGIDPQLKEVVTHSQKAAPGSDRHPTVKDGLRAIESMVWEVGDDLIEATLRFKAIAKLRQELLGVSPSVSLYDEFCRSGVNETAADIVELFGDDHLALVAVVQHLDLKEFMETGMVKGLKLSSGLGPLTSTESPSRRNRPRNNTKPGKRKVVMNQYVRPDMRPAFRAHILDRLRSTTVKDFHDIFDECLADLVAEIYFHEAKLNEFDEFNYGPMHEFEDGTRQYPVQHAIDFIRRQLEELEPARV